MQIEAASMKNIITANSKMDFEIGTLSGGATEQAAEDKVFIGCGENEYPEEYHENKTKNNDKGKEKISLLKENIDKLNESVAKNDSALFEEMGFAADKEDVTTLVTVSDRVKIQMARYNEGYQTTGSNIDIAVLEEVTGSESGAYQIAAKLEEAYNMAKEIGASNKDCEEYLLRNNTPPTISNIYMAKHSGAKSRESSDTLTDEQWSKIKPQVEGMLENVGIEVTTDRLENSKWIIEQKIPLTPENVLNLEEIQSIDADMSDSELLGKMMNNVLAGINPKDTLLTTGSDYLSRAVEALNIIELATDEDLANVIASGKELTVANLNSTKTNTEAIEIENVTAKRLLEETRLMMSIEANLRMLKNGINIEIEPLKNIVNELKNYEKEYYETIYSSVDYAPSVEEIDLLKTTIDAVEALKSVPSPVIGKLLYEEEQLTISDLKSKAETALNRYEEMSTQIRNDLGDSYSKAFQSVDSILEDLELEVNKANVSAVKILSYNNSEVNQESVYKIKTAYEQFSRLVENLKPKTAAYLIKEKINPLNTEISELNSEIEEINAKIGATEEEKYSEFLWKIDKNKEFSKEERDAFVGTYRLMYLVEKGDFSAIGSLIKQGTDITLNNLATAVKSKKAQNMNVKINDDFGELTQLNMPEINLSSQLEYYGNLVKDCREKMTPVGLKNIFEKINNEKISLESLAGEIEETYVPESDKNIFAELKAVSDEAMQSLLDTNQKITPQNLIFSGQIVGSKRGVFKFLDEEVDLESDKFVSALEDSETIDKVYDQMNKSVKEIISEKLEAENPETIDINKLKLMSQSVEMLSNMSLRKQYQIPIELDGEACLLKLTVINNSEDSGKVTVETDSENLGKISSEFRLENESLKGIILTDSIETNEFIKSSLEELGEKLKEIGISKTDLRTNLHTGIKDGMWKEKQTEANVETKKLYKVAKIFIEQIVQKRGNA